MGRLLSDSLLKVGGVGRGKRVRSSSSSTSMIVVSFCSSDDESLEELLVGELFVNEKAGLKLVSDFGRALSSTKNFRFLSPDFDLFRPLASF